MANISDIIEDFILSTFGEDDLLELSRNELANFFSCAPSQINYVLSTRFTPDKGYIIESRRGGGGSIKVYKLTDDKNTLLSSIIKDLEKNSHFTANKANSIISRLVRDELLSEKEGDLLTAVVSDKALAAPINIATEMRKKIFIEAMRELQKRK